MNPDIYYLEDKFYSRLESRVEMELILLGFKNYTRQYPIGKYFADFFFKNNNLVLEIDGKEWHTKKEDFARDRIRDKYMNDTGFCVVRVSGSFAYDNPAGVINAIRNLTKPITYFVESEDDLKRLLTGSF